MSDFLKSVVGVGLLGGLAYFVSASGFWEAYVVSSEYDKALMESGGASPEAHVKRMQEAGAAFRASPGGRAMKKALRSNRSAAEKKIVSYARRCIDQHALGDVVDFQKGMMAINMAQLVSTTLIGPSKGDAVRFAEMSGEFALNGDPNFVSKMSITQMISGQKMMQLITQDPSKIANCMADLAVKSMI